MEKSIKGTRTEQNLLKAFAGESQARSRYVFFASKAKKEGYEQIAGVFAETAEQEKEHAERFFKFLEGGDVEITASYPTGNTGRLISGQMIYLETGEVLHTFQVQLEETDSMFGYTITGLTLD